MFVDIYAIQNVPPSNINRDDTGSPKTAYYGGSLRARVSSQAWKKAMRDSFRKVLPEEKLGVRTKLVPGEISDRICVKDPDLKDSSDELAASLLKIIGIKTQSSTRAGSQQGNDETGYLVFISERELDKLADLAVQWAHEGADWKKPDTEMKKVAKDIFHGTQAIDIALFGRMLADAPDLNVDAASQVAHAISVDTVRQEADYFTALDDLANDDNAGAAMIDSTGFNASTLYRYANVNVDSLADQIDDNEAVADAVVAFVEAFVRSMPSGKQNSFANHTLPEVVIVSLRKDQPINMVSAFEKPVRADADHSVSENAVELLTKKIEKVEKDYDVKAKHSWSIGTETGTTLEKLKQDLHNAVLDSLKAGQEA
ncbi:type I-E CRISPR-associated protein Cas7/Cse4/CasC [Bifidobacterium sp. ESL0784]|uniref:type I-E CRISPR-associated protein Cas7/Cse4/CasC n=1 Tax=Bifidobacterium sp. ESL0784 TaxID=2983231 RepID=UPI0023F881D1|nr:type I-E CRISPR-associated protein Cas7/Cse4/CasC [Bifidobacterium sp. ESL0784]MDF7641706.1 type I-E CRISPR-associated protein Cas7/Cse4/CasC [Bifidobacterium sp. ESL0784]